MYRILHDNGQEYGPVTAEAVRQWICEGRAHGRTRVKMEGDAEWRLLGELPEFGGDLHTAGVSRIAGRMSGMAITSLVLGICGLITCGLTSLIGLVLGIISLVKINRSHGALRGTGFAIAGIAVSALFILLLPIQLAMLLPALAKAKAKAQTVTCVNNLKQLSLAIRMYEVDFGVYPGTNWCDQLKSAGLIQGPELECPGHQAGACAYALNTAVAGKKSDEIPNPSMVLFFESDLGYNACAGEDSIITAPRHGEVYNVGLVDGSVQQQRDLTLLQWAP